MEMIVLDELYKAPYTPFFEDAVRERIGRMSANRKKTAYEWLIADNVANDIMHTPRNPRTELLLKIFSEYVEWDETKVEARQIDKRLTQGDVKKILDALEDAGYCDEWRAGEKISLCAMACQLIQDKTVWVRPDTIRGTHEYKPFEDYFGVKGLAKIANKIEKECRLVRGYNELEEIISRAVEK